MAYTLAGDYQTARDYVYKLWPFRADHDQWQQEITEKGITECEFASALQEAGDDIGQAVRPSHPHHG